MIIRGNSPTHESPPLVVSLKSLRRALVVVHGAIATSHQQVDVAVAVPVYGTRYLLLRTLGGKILSLG